MFRKQILFLLLIIVLLAACGELGLSNRVPLTSTPEHSTSSPIGQLSPVLKLELSSKLPMGWRAEQALIIKNVVYFSNFGLTNGGAPDTTPVIAAFDLAAEKLLWHVEQRPLIPMSSDGERLFALTNNGLVAISTTDGSVLWQTSVAIDDGYSEGDELLARDGWVFYAKNKVHGSELHALDAHTGTTVWTVSLITPIDWFRPSGGPLHWDEYGALAYDHGTLYVRVIADLAEKKTFRFTLLALEAKDGHRLWDFSFETPATQGDAPPGGASRLAFNEQGIYFGAFGGTSYALQRDTGKVLWDREVNIDYPFYIDGQIITVSGYQTIKALDARTGNVEWAVPFMDDNIGMVSPFIFYDGYLIFYSGGFHEGQLSVVNLASGEKTFTAQPTLPGDCDTLPVAVALYDKHLYLVTLNCIHRFLVS